MTQDDAGVCSRGRGSEDVVGPSAWWWFAAMGLVAAYGGTSGCSGGGSSPGPGVDAAALPSDGGGSSCGTATGSVAGAAFGTAASCLWIGSPDSAATSVVYVFSTAVQCSELQRVGWDTRIANGTHVLETKSYGTTPATYNVTTSMTPAPGEASVNYTLSSTSGTPAETFSSAGFVTLTALRANTFATGSFDLTFAADKLAGTFNATFCPGGHEP